MCVCVCVWVGSEHEDRTTDQKRAAVTSGFYISGCMRGIDLSQQLLRGGGPSCGRLWCCSCR